MLTLATPVSQDELRSYDQLGELPLRNSSAVFSLFQWSHAWMLHADPCSQPFTSMLNPERNIPLFCLKLLTM